MYLFIQRHEETVAQHLEDRCAERQTLAVLKSKLTERQDCETDRERWAEQTEKLMGQTGRQGDRWEDGEE